MTGPDIFKSPEHEAEHQPATDRSAKYHWQQQTIAATFERIRRDPDHPWVAVGDFLDDWRFTTREDRPELVREGIAPAGGTLDLRRWAAFCAAMVEWLCRQDELPFPTWTSQ